MITFLSENNYIGSNESAIIEDGRMAYTHIALLSIPNISQPIQCYIKMYPATFENSDRENRALLNEIVGYVVGKTLNLPVPTHGGIITLKSHQLTNIPEWADEEELLAWWVQDMYYPCLRQYYNFSDKDHNSIFDKKINNLVDELLHSDLTKQIIAFDDLIANIDRNLGNLLKTPKGDFILIDHGLCLTSDHWLSSDLIPENNYQNKILTMIKDKIEMDLKFKHTIVESKRLLLEQIETVVNNLQELLNCFAENSDIAAIEHFLTNRYINDRFEKHIGLLV